MERKIIFKTLSPYSHGPCADLPPGTVEAEGLCVPPGVSPVDDDSFQWNGPAMRLEPSFPDVVFPEIDFSLAAAEVISRKITFNVKCKVASPYDILVTLSGTATDVREEARREVIETMSGLVTKKVEEFVESADKGGYFLGPFRIAAALRLKDGSLVPIPSPKLLVPNDRAVEVALTGARISGDSVVVDCVILCQPVLVCRRLISSGTIPSSGVSVEVYATSPAPVWMKGVTAEFTGSVGSGRTEAGTLDSSDRLVNVSSDHPQVEGVGVSRGWRFRGISAPVPVALQRAESAWHRIATIPFSDITDMRRELLYLRTSISGLTSAKGIPLEFSACSVPVSGWTRMVADRTVAVRCPVRLPDPTPPAGWLPVDLDSGGNETGWRLTEVFARFADGTVLGATVKNRLVAAPDSGRLREWFYPAPGVRKIVICCVSSQSGSRSVGFVMADDAGSGASVSLSSMTEVTGDELTELRRKAVAPGNHLSEAGSVMFDWEAGSVPVCTSLHRQTFTSARLCGVSLVLPRIGNDVYPPLWLMADDGVRMLRWNSSGGWRQAGIVSSDCCLMPEDIIECGSLTFYRSSEGLRLISGSSVKPVNSPSATGRIDSLLDILPGAAAIIGGAPGQADSSLAYEKGDLTYCVAAGLLRLRDGESKLYLDVETLEWVSSPGSEGSAPDESDIRRWMVTAPMDLGVRRIRSVRFIGCSLKEELRVALYVSDNLSDWRPVSSGHTIRGKIGPVCGSGGRFWRILTVGTRPESAFIGL